MCGNHGIPQQLSTWVKPDPAPPSLQAGNEANSLASMREQLRPLLLSTDSLCVLSLSAGPQ